MRYFLSILGALAAIVLLFVSAAMNWRFGFILGKTELDAHIYGAASAAADGLKALLPFFVMWAFRQRLFIHILAGSMLWVVCTAYSLSSAIGFAALNRQDTAGARVVEATNYQDLRAELDRAKKKLSWVPKHRSVGEVDADLKALLAQPIKSRRGRTLGTVGVLTSDCTSSAFRAQRLCVKVLNLRKELAVAKQAAKLEGQIIKLKAQTAHISQQTKGVAVAEADPQAALLAELTGVDTAKIQTGLVILVAILVELGSGMGLFVAFSHIRGDEPRKGENHKTAVLYEPEISSGGATNSASVEGPVHKLMLPKSDLERFYTSRIEKVDGSSITAMALYEDYCDWCNENSKEPMALPVFGRQFSEFGTQKAKIGGRIRYIGIRLKVAKSKKAKGSADIAVAS